MSFAEIKKAINSNLNKTLDALITENTTKINSNVTTCTNEIISSDNSVIFKNNVSYLSKEANSSTSNTTVFSITGKGKLHCLTTYAYIIGQTNTANYNNYPFLNYTFKLYKDGSVFRQGTFTITDGGWAQIGISIMSNAYLKTRPHVKTNGTATYDIDPNIKSNAKVSATTSNLSKNFVYNDGGLTTATGALVFESLRADVIQVLLDSDITFNSSLSLVISGTPKKGTSSYGQTWNTIVYELN